MRSLRGSAFFSSLGKGGVIKIGAILLLGAVLLVFGFMGSKEQTEEKSDTDDESRLAEMCSAVEGVGECRVMITYVKESSTFGSSVKESVGGVTVLCRGGSSVIVKQRLTKMICSLFDIGANRVIIEKLN